MRLYLFLLLVASGYVIPGYAGKKLHVLFLGNSYTHVNNMPQIVADMASTTGDTLVFDMYAPGGYTIDNHALDTASENRIKKGGWDYLILQEQSQLPSFQTYQSNELFGLCALFRQYNPCGRIMFYMTWGRENGDATNCANWPPVCTYLGMDSLLRLRYTQMAVSNKGELSPAGAAWRYARQNNPGIDLYAPDESHPSTAGSYLVACCFYTAIFKKDPTAVDDDFVLSATNANTLRQIAKAVVFDSLSTWDHAVTLPVTDFYYTVGDGSNQINCINQSSFADTYMWDFGDGTTSTVQHPVHNYTDNGTYTITLYAYNCDIDTTYGNSRQREVTFCPFTPMVTPQEVTLCPGVSDTLSTQLYDTYQWYDAYHNAIPGAIGQYLVVSTEGRYYVQATLNGCSESSVPVEVTAAANFTTWSILSAGKLLAEDSACIGDTIILRLAFNKPPIAGDSLMDWRFNGHLITGYHNDTLMITQSGVYEAKMRHDKCPSLDRTHQVNFTFVPCGPDIEDLEERLFIVAPNPVHDVLSISSRVFLSATYSIRLVNQLGQVIYLEQSKAAEQQSLTLSGYASGIYFISVSKGGNTLYRDRIVKR